MKIFQLSNLFKQINQSDTITKETQQGDKNDK